MTSPESWRVRWRRAALAGFLSSPLVFAGCATAPSLYDKRLIDLTHTLRDKDSNGPQEAAFEYERVAGADEDGRWHATGTFAGPEDSGTHLEAPMRLGEGRNGADEVPLSRLVGPIRVIDVQAKCRTQANYVVTLADLRAHERDYGRIPRGAAVLVCTGWDRNWGQPDRYFGTLDSPHHPGLSVEFARELVDRAIDLVGIDGPSLDGAVLDVGGGEAARRERPVQRVLADANVPAFTDLAAVRTLPAIGATLIALPMKLDRSGASPARVVAVVP